MKKLLLSCVFFCTLAVHGWAGSFASIAIDGSFDDWTSASIVMDDVQGDAGGASLDIKRVWMANDDQNLYVRVDLWAPAQAWLGADANLTFFIDTDGTTTTGFNAFGTNMIGSEIMGAYDLYSEIAGGYNDGALGAILGHESLMTTAASFELALPRGLRHPGVTGNPLSQAYIFGAAAQAEFLIVGNTSGAFDTVPNNTPGFTPLTYQFETNPAETVHVGTYAHIAIDGSFDDWTSASIVTEDPQADAAGGELDIKRIWMANDENYLYVRVQSWEALSAANLVMFLDTDKLVSSGFNAFGLGMIGSEALMAGGLFSEGFGGWNDGYVAPVNASPAFADSATDWEFAIPRNAKHPASISGPLASQPMLGVDGSQIGVLTASSAGASPDFVPSGAAASSRMIYQLAAPASDDLVSVFNPIAIDGSFDEWTSASIILEDAQGDSASGFADLRRVWMANDENNVYLRLDLWEPLAGSQLSTFFDTDNFLATGFDAFGRGMVGSDLLLSVSDVYSEGDGGFNNGYVGAVTVSPQITDAASSWEISIPRSYVHPASLASAFAGQPIFGGDLSIMALMVVSDTSVPNDLMPNDAAAASRLRYQMAAFAPEIHITALTVLDDLNLEVTFDQAMSDQALLAANYTLSGSGRGTLAAQPASVTSLGGNTYRLSWTQGVQEAGLDLTLTVTPAMMSAAGRPIGQPNNVYTAAGISVPVGLSALAVE